MQCCNILSRKKTQQISLVFRLKALLSTFMTDDVINLVTSGNVMEAAPSELLLISR